MSSFVKLDRSILDKSIWSEPNEIRIAWITLLAMCDADGIVEASIPGIAARAHLSLADVEKAIKLFESPDPYSTNPANEGRRVERIISGFRILNFCHYRQKDYGAAARMQKYRQRKRNEEQSAPEIAAAPPKKKISKRKDIDLLAEHLLKTLRIPLSDRAQTEGLLKSFGLAYMTEAVDRMGRYFAEVKSNRWKEFVIGKHWRNLYEKLEYFSSDENLENKIRETARSNSQPIKKIDGRTVATDFSADEELAKKQREKWGIKEGDNVQT